MFHGPWWVADVVQCGTHILRWVGVSCLMSVVILSHGRRQLMCARSGVGTGDVLSLAESAC